MTLLQSLTQPVINRTQDLQFPNFPLVIEEGTVESTTQKFNESGVAIFLTGAKTTTDSKFGLLLCQRTTHLDLLELPDKLRTNKTFYAGNQLPTIQILGTKVGEGNGNRLSKSGGDNCHKLGQGREVQGHYNFEKLTHKTTHLCSTDRRINTPMTRPMTSGIITRGSTLLSRWRTVGAQALERYRNEPNNTEEMDGLLNDLSH